MKIKRHKHTKNVLKFYKVNFNIDSKHINILIDGTFANEALNSKINLAEQLPTFFDVQPKHCKLFTTKCAIKETEMLGKPTYGAMLILKQYELVECNHKREYVTSEKCFKNVLNESKQNNSQMKYFMATQSESLKKIVRDICGIPLLIISYNAINLERPSYQTLNYVNQENNKKAQPKETELEVVKKLKKELDTSKQVKRLHKHRKAKGPNPLSCKKPHKKQNKKNSNFSNKNKA